MFGESISILEGLKITLLSMIIVFLALWIISKILDLFKVVFYERESKPEKQDNMRSSVASKSNEKEEIIIKSIDDESTLMAAITAAIMASNENKKSKIHIRSIKRVS